MIELINNLGINSTSGLIGLGLASIGFFLILAGFGIISIEKITVQQGKATWIVGIILAVIGVLLVIPEFETSKPITASPTVPPSTTELSEFFLECGDPEIWSIQPPELLEGKMQLYTVVGSGFCSSTEVFLDCQAWVGKSAGIGTADGTPASVSSDGTELTVYIYFDPLPDSQLSVNLGVENPGSQAAILNVKLQRTGD